MGLGAFRFLSQGIFADDDTARQQARDARRGVDELEDRLNRLALLTTALWSLASERLGISEEELQTRVEQIDLSDGKLDGRVSVAFGECPECRRRVAMRHRACLYCGAVLPTKLPG